MPDDPSARFAPQSEAPIRRQHGSVSLRELGRVLVRRRRVALGILGGLLLLCILYCLVAPSQYEAAAKIELRSTPASALNLQPGEPSSNISAPVALETVAGVLRSDQLAWTVITRLRLYDAPGFRGRFAAKFPGFRPDSPSPETQSWLLERFARRLQVQTQPRTLLLQLRFRSRDAVLSAAVVNALIAAYVEQENESQVAATAQASGWLQGQLGALKARMDADEQRLAAFESAHGIVATPETLPSGQPGETQHNTAALELDEMGRELVAATTARILAESQYHAATAGDPEMVVAADPGLQSENSGFALGVLQQIHSQRSQLEQEQARLSAEHGPSFPRVVEIGRQLADLDRQRQAEDAKLVERFRSNWQTALDRERLVRKGLDATTGEGLRNNQAATQYAAMRQEANASREVYIKVLEKVEEAGLAAGIPGSNIAVIDAARQPAKPVAPDLPLSLAITFFAGLWLAIAGALLAESSVRSKARVAAMLLIGLMSAAGLRSQAPTPSTSGLPTGVVNLPQSRDTRNIPNPLPNPREAPAVWGNPAGAAPTASPLAAAPMPAPIAAGDVLDVSESHTPEFRSTVRVSPSGLVTLPMIGDVKVAGMDEPAAAHAIEAALVAKGMLSHPLVAVLVTAFAGQDVSVLGEVARPGVYAYSYHHRLLDLIAAASGLSQNAGRTVTIFHTGDPGTPHPVLLDPDGSDSSAGHNPELSPGDTIEVSRAGLVYVVGDVIRPGGFLVDPAQKLTVVQALTLAWGPSLNAAASKAVLIREQKGGRTLTRLNLRRMLQGKDPDLPIEDRDILYVPDSMAKNLMNRTMESAIQSTIGVGIYSGLVYSQRY